MAKEIKNNQALIPEPRTEIITIETVEDLISVAQKRMETVPRLVEMALKVTNYRDWVDQSGNPYLTHSGAEKIARLFGVKISNINTTKDWTEDTRGKYYIYKTTGTVALPGTIDSIEAIGTCSQRDGFFAKAKGEWLDTIEIDETNILKASYSNFIVNGITHLLGLRNLTWEQVEKAGVDRKRVMKIDYQSGSQKVKKTATPEEIKRQKEIWDWLMQITAGNDELARERLKLETGFKPKDGSDYVEGKKDPKYLTGKWLNITHRKIREIFEKQFSEEEAEK
jgi:hypothetical protein